MEQIVKGCYLTSEQRQVILQGIMEGKAKFEDLKSQIGHTTTKTGGPRLRYDLINTHVEENIKSNPHLSMEVHVKRSGSYPYIVLHDFLRNKFVLVLRLQKEIFDPSRYRGENAFSNVDRLMEMGLKLEDLPNDYNHQYSLFLGAEHQPFGIIVCYDAYKDIVYEGALRPDQNDWLYKENITDYIDLKTNKVTHIKRPEHTDKIELSLKKQSDEEEITLKLKK